MRFTMWTLRVTLICFVFIGFQVVSANFFVVTGRPKISIFLSLLRQGVVLIPCVLIFGKIWGLWGVIASGPVADSVAIIVTGIMIGFELRKLRKMITN
ncbi:MAG: MATE family efflux transporter, partial [Treponema sp.]|nr:MATE family efflux transporter [Treponema sp.]